MTCNSCGEPKKKDNSFTKAVIEINNPETLVLFRKVVIPASMGNDTEIPAAIGKYHNVLLVYESNNHAYLYSSDGIPTLLTSDVAQEIEEKINQVANDLDSEIANRQNADAGLQQQINAKANSADLASVATSGLYSDLSGTPTIGDGTLILQENGASLGSFSANTTQTTTVNITVPTKTSDLTNDGADNTSTYVEADELATVATTGNYSDLNGAPAIPAAQVQSDWAQSDTAAVDYIQNKPTIPTVNDATLTIQQNGTDVATFTANSSTNATANIVAPVITMTSTDPGEGAPLAQNNFIAVYSAS